MNKNTVLESMYKVIEESLMWGVDADDYGMFVDGVVAMTDEMLERLNRTELETSQE